MTQDGLFNLIKEMVQKNDKKIKDVKKNFINF